MSLLPGRKWTPERIVQTIRWCGVIVTLLSLLWVTHTLLFIVRAEQTEGLIVAWEPVLSKSRDSNGFTVSHTYWYAIVTFRDASGAQHRSRSPRGLNEQDREVGQPVPIYYDAKDPSQIFVRDLGVIWFPPGFMTGFGVFILLLTSGILRWLRLKAGRDAAEVADIVARYISKKKPEPAVSTLPPAEPAPPWVAFAPPPGKTFTNVLYCDSEELDPALVAEFKNQGPEVLLLLAVNAQHLVLQTREKARRVLRSDICAISVYPVLPAKACGHVQMHLELQPQRPGNHLEFFMCGPHSEELQNWCLDKARNVASILGVPVTLLEPGHDC